MGKKHWTVPELRADVNVKQLLDGVESAQERREQQQSFSKYDLRGARIQNFAPEGEGTALMAGKTVENSVRRAASGCLGRMDPKPDLQPNPRQILASEHPINN